MDGDPARDRVNYHHGDLRRALLDEMDAVVRAEGVDAVSLRALARTLGVAPSAAFRHFRDKRALVTAYAAEALGTMRAECAARAALAEPGPKQFRAIGEGYIAFARAAPNRFRAMCARPLLDPQDPALVAAGEEMDALVADIMAGLDGGPLPVDGAAVALLSWASVHGLVTLALDGWIDGVDPDDPLGAPQVEAAFGALGLLFDAACRGREGF